FTDLLAENWFSLLLLLLTLGLGASLLLLRYRRKTWSLPLLLSGSAVGLIGAGGMLLPVDSGLWIGAAMLAVLFVMLLVVITSGSWWAPLGYTVGAVLLLAIGGAACETVGEWLAETGKVALSLEPTQPWWLLLLGLIPVIIFLSYRSLAGLG